MNKLKLKQLYFISLICIGAATLILIGDNLFQFGLSDLIKRICGIIDLAALMALSYSFVKMRS